MFSTAFRLIFLQRKCLQPSANQHWHCLLHKEHSTAAWALASVRTGKFFPMGLTMQLFIIKGVIGVNHGLGIVIKSAAAAHARACTQELSDGSNVVESEAKELRDTNEHEARAPRRAREAGGEYALGQTLHALRVLRVIVTCHVQHDVPQQLDAALPHTLQPKNITGVGF